MNTACFSVSGPEWPARALAWACGHEACLLLHPGGQAYPGGGFPRLLAVGTPQQPDAQADPFAWAQEEWARQGWLFGYWGYDLKNRLERLESRNGDFMGFPDCLFFAPQVLVEWLDDATVRVAAADPEQAWAAMSGTPPPEAVPTRLPQGLRAATPKERYLEQVLRIQRHIEEGDVYELNYCQAFEAEGAMLEPQRAFWELSRRSPMPFGAFLKFGPCYALSASPERFLKKTGDRLLAQPIKGTVRRGATPEDDARLAQALRESEKEQAENLMIVDLVRNDLAKHAVWGSVEVEELFGIYGFRQVHQMISSVGARLRPDVPGLRALAGAFPMGSMTGAPKVRAMELIEALEDRRRGLFSGAIGYCGPNGDFDFNVVIRTLFYREDRRRLSFQVGSAITYDADAEREYEECLLKAQAMLEVLGVSL